eukprot:1044414-Rhodomonas_salina.1
MGGKREVRRGGRGDGRLCVKGEEERDMQAGRWRRRFVTEIAVGAGGTKGAGGGCLDLCELDEAEVATALGVLVQHHAC